MKILACISVLLIAGEAHALDLYGVSPGQPFDQIGILQATKPYHMEPFKSGNIVVEQFTCASYSCSGFLKFGTAP